MRHILTDHKFPEVLTLRKVTYRDGKLWSVSLVRENQIVKLSKRQNGENLLVVASKVKHGDFAIKNLRSSLPPP